MSASWDKYEFSNNGKDSCTGGGGVTCLSVNKKYKLNPVLYQFDIEINWLTFMFYA